MFQFELQLLPKDLENGTFEVARRDNLSKEVVAADGIENYIANLLSQIQADLFNNALSYRESHITEVNSFEEFKSVLEGKGGFIFSPLGCYCCY